jgi:hypothetical protein
MATAVSEILVAILTRMGVAIVEALAVRLLRELWAAYTRSQQRTNAAVA